MNEANPVTAYKTLLASIIDRRPSGTRQRLADALAKNRSFVTQITNPAYATPVPASHLDVIFEICHFSPVERRHFLEAYDKAHPRRRAGTLDTDRREDHMISLPDLGDPLRNSRLRTLVRGFIDDIVQLIDTQPARGKRK